jgi:hypothetical protein
MPSVFAVVIPDIGYIDTLHELGYVKALRVDMKMQMII